VQENRYSEIEDSLRPGSKNEQIHFVLFFVWIIFAGLEILKELNFTIEAI
jgi:hypothetical protein